MRRIGLSPFCIANRAEALRAGMTDAEQHLWKELRGRRLSGFGFRRQTPIGAFTVDFVCHGRKLVVELDGGQHALRFAADIERDAWLRMHGYRVLRFWNGDVLRNCSGILAVLMWALRQAPPPQRSPSRGEGGPATDSERGAADVLATMHAPHE